MPSEKNLIECVGRVLVGSPANSTTPDAEPADTIAYGTSWGGTWVDLGFITADGMNAGGLSTDRTAVYAWQQRTPILQLPGNAAEMISFTFFEMTFANVRRAMGRGNIVTIPAAVGVPGREELKFEDDVAGSVIYYALGFELLMPNGQPMRGIYPITVPSITGDVNFTHGKASQVAARFDRAGDDRGNPKWWKVLAAL